MARASGATPRGERLSWTPALFARFPLGLFLKGDELLRLERQLGEPIRRVGKRSLTERRSTTGPKG